MTRLNKLLLSGNDLVGTIPPSLGNLSSLQNISLARNHLVGSIPRVLGRLSNLKKLNLGLNTLSGVVPDSLYNLSNIQILALNENKLSGTFPSKLQLAFPHLRGFLVGENQFDGTFPSSISNITGLERFDISSNGFSGPIPLTLGSLNKLQLLHIGYNSFGSGRGRDLDFLSSLTNCTQLRILILDGNGFGGEVPGLIGNFSTYLRTLSMGLNEISGTIPEGIWQLIGLTDFTVQDNYLEGTIPDSFGRLKNLVGLDLGENKLSGNIPTAIGNLTILSELSLHSNSFVGGIPLSLKYCTRMQTFNVSTNNLNGDIPNQTFGNFEGLVPSKKHKRSYRKKVILIIAIVVGVGLVTSTLFVTIHLFRKRPKAPSTSWSPKNKAIPEGITEIADSRLLVSNVEEGRRMMESKVRECLVALAGIGVGCSAELPVERMDIKDVVLELHSIKQRLCH
ncbi:uncharacterized protein HKW66_Vig0130200 [Vigna angularis]|uniref:Leucine-rich repeat-containing N-terminal plant-type domain-containing protein n=1 Tax=Phaseolus angularis TaxID=3914 RepID=A0A8T0K3E1_PHAAN|nr:uncharacterized protein HKW66_Vig0130200 [Vigna angularis]